MSLTQQHKKLERNITLLAVATFVTVAIGGAVEIAPLFWIDNTIEEVDGMRPYSPLEQAGQFALREEAGQEHAVGDALACGLLADAVGLVAGARHDEDGLRPALQQLRRSLDEKAGAFLQRDPPREDDDAVAGVGGVELFEQMLPGRVLRKRLRRNFRGNFRGGRGVVDDGQAGGGDAVVPLDELGGVAADDDDAIRSGHAAPLELADLRVRCVAGAGAVDLGRVQMHHQRLARIRGDGSGCGEGHPVMSMHHVEGLAARGLDALAGVLHHLLVKHIGVGVGEPRRRLRGQAGRWRRRGHGDSGADAVDVEVVRDAVAGDFLIGAVEPGRQGDERGAAMPLVGVGVGVARGLRGRGRFCGCGFRK